MRQPMHELPECQDDEGLRTVPPDVLELSIHHSIKENTNWPRPSGNDIKRSIKTCRSSIVRIMIE